MHVVTPVPPDISNQRLPTAPRCPVTGEEIDMRLGLWPIHFSDEDGIRRCILCGAADKRALVDIHDEPQTYGLLAWIDHLEQACDESGTHLPLSY